MHQKRQKLSEFSSQPLTPNTAVIFIKHHKNRTFFTNIFSVLCSLNLYFFNLCQIKTGHNKKQKTRRKTAFVLRKHVFILCIVMGGSRGGATGVGRPRMKSDWLGTKHVNCADMMINIMEMQSKNKLIIGI